jgi:hypothetical protein
MTPWQTALRRESSSAEMVIPQLAPAKTRLDDAMAMRPQVAGAALLRSLTEQAVVALKWLRQKSTQKFSSRRLRVSETVALGEKRFVTILQVDGTQLLIGSAAGQVSLLAILDEEKSAWRAGSPKEQSA